MRRSLIGWSAGVVLLAASAGLPAAAPETGMNEFACSLYKELSKGRDNVFFAPFSVGIALAMTAEGARGETAAQMGRVLGLAPGLKSADDERPYDWAPFHAHLGAIAAHVAPQPAAPDVLAKLETLRRELAAANADAEKLMHAGSFGAEYSAAARRAERLAREINTLQAGVDPTEFRSANALWLERTFALGQPYLDTIGRYYGTGNALPVDFRGDAEGARTKINDWVAAQTNQRIKDLLGRGMVTAATRLVLTNAVYFLGEWLEPFDVEQTKDGPFRLAGGGSADAKLMTAHLEGIARYAAFNADGSAFATPKYVQDDDDTLYPSGGFQVVELPYRGGKVVMQVILPAEPDDLPVVEALLDAANLARWNAVLEKRDVRVTLPKFRLEAGAELSAALQSLGMPRAFVGAAPEAGGAQFQGMTGAGDPLHIGVVVHKAFVQVDEKGTEAAAATAVGMVALSAPMDFPFVPEFVADRPFVFAIRETKTGTVLFLGRLARPE